MAEKRAIRLYSAWRTKLLQPSRQEVYEYGIFEWCASMRLSPEASARVATLCADPSQSPLIDWRDHRSLPLSDRVPRSLEEIPFTKDYWQIAGPDRIP